MTVNNFKMIRRLVYLIKRWNKVFFANHVLTEISMRLGLSHAYGQPIIVHFEPTTYCNATCSMCSRNSTHNANLSKNPKNMSLKTFREMLLKFPYCEDVRMQGLGESLLNPEMLEMIKLCKSRKIRVSLTTNASLLSESMSRELIMSGIDSILFSVDSANAKTFERLRKGIKFSAVIDNIKRFVELRNRLKSKMPFTALTISVSKDNIREIPQLIDIAKSLGVDGVVLRRLLRLGYGPSDIESKKQLELLRSYEHYGKSRGLHVTLLFPEELFSTSKVKKTHCWWLWRAIYLTVDGDVFPCCIFPHHTGIAYGNVMRQSVREIWNNEMYKRLRVHLRSGNLCAPCNACPTTRVLRTKAMPTNKYK